MPETTINDTIVAILYKLVSEQSLLPEEQVALDSWLAGSEHKKALLAELMNEDRLFDEIKKRYAFNTTGEWLKMVEKLRAGSAATSLATGIADPDTYAENAPVVHRIHFLKTSWFRYAAAIIIVITGAAIWYTQSAKSDKSHKSAVQTIVVDIAPGSSKALLTLADGSTIVLDEAQNGNLVQQGSAQVVKLANGQLAYKVGNKLSREMLYNTMTTPRGGQYRLTLPDGSNVWLNAASSIKYPTVFVGAERIVEVTGEVYMEVAQNAKQPFIVKADGTEIRVLGTSFNINAYEDEESQKTTLVEGSVRVNNTILKPSQEAVVTGESLKVQSADIQQTLAWKNGVFNFNNADIKGMMRQLARWYDVEVIYEGKTPERIFEGKMQRNIPLSSALKILELNKINFRVEGRKIIVMP